MAIETQMGMGIREILNSYETRNGVQATKVDGVNHKLKLLDAPEVKSEEVIHKSFIDFLSDSVNRVNNLQKDAHLAIEQLTSGKTKNIHETMLAVEQAEIAFKVMNQVRSKVIDAYREVMRMQV